MNTVQKHKTDSMHKVYKYELLGNFENPIATVPVDAKLLDIEVQNGRFFVWALVDTREKETEQWKFEVYGTGWEITNPDELTHHKTLHVAGLVWHIFTREQI